MNLTEAKNAGAVEAELVRSSFLTRYHCHVCGGNTGKNLVLCEVTSGPYNGLRVCETCLREANIVERIEKHARELEGHAADLREVAGRLVVLTYDEWQCAESRANRDHYQQPGGAARPREERA